MPGFYPARRRFDSFRSHSAVRGVEAACRTLTPSGAGGLRLRLRRRCSGPRFARCDSRRTDSNFGIVQLAGRETLNLAIQVRALVPKPRRDTCVRRDACVSRSLTTKGSFFRGRHAAGRRGCYPLLIARSTRALGALSRSFWEGTSLVAKCARFESADRLQPWQAAQKKLSAELFRPVRLLVRMLAFQASESGSIPERVTRALQAVLVKAPR